MAELHRDRYLAEAKSPFDAKMDLAVRPHDLSASSLESSGDFLDAVHPPADVPVDEYTQ